MSDILMWSNMGWEGDYDHIDQEYEYSSLVTDIREFADGKPILLVDAHGLDWRGSKGYKLVNLNDKWEEVIANLIPDYDNTFRVYKTDDGGLYATVSSHDVPMGGTWNLTAIEDVEETMNDIACQLGDGSTGTELSDLYHLMRERLGLDVEQWKHTDATHKLVSKLQEDTRLIEIGDQSIDMYLSKDWDTIVRDMDYCLEDIQEAYIKQYLRG